MGDQQPMADQVAGAGRAELQDWTGLPQILTREVWQVLESREERQLKKIDVLVKYLVTFGLRHPTERTCAVICALIARNDGMEADTPRQVALLATVKSVLKTSITRAKQAGMSLPGGYLAVLPADPGNLPQALRSRFDLVVSPVELVPVMHLAHSWALRASNRSVQLARLQQGAIVLPAPGVSPLALLNNPVALQTGHAWAALGQLGVGPVASHQGVPGLHLTPAGVAAAAAAAAGAPAGRQAGGPLRALLDRAQTENLEQSGAAQAVSVTPSLSAPAPSAPQVATCGVAGTQAELATQSVSAPVSAAVPSATKPSGLEGAPATVPLAVADASAVEPIGTAQELEESIAALAQQHYDKELPTSGGNGNSAKKKPSASARTVAKKPGTNMAGQRKMGAMKKPAAANPKRVAQPKVLKRPAAKACSLTRLEAARERPNGCAKCRNKVGCTPSCWKERGRQLVD